MRLFITVLALSAFAISSVATNGPAQATTYDLPLDGTISIDDNGLAGQTPIEIQAVEGFSLPVFNQQSPQTTVGVYQWIANFSVLDQNGTPVSEPSLSPFGTALTGYGQNCSTRPYCPSPSGPSSETILSGTLFISGDATLDISTIISGENIVSDNLELLLNSTRRFYSAIGNTLARGSALVRYRSRSCCTSQLAKETKTEVSGLVASARICEPPAGSQAIIPLTNLTG